MGYIEALRIETNERIELRSNFSSMGFVIIQERGFLHPIHVSALYFLERKSALYMDLPDYDKVFKEIHPPTSPTDMCTGL